MIVKVDTVKVEIEWIKIAESLPEEGRLVLLYSPSYESCGWLSDGYWCDHPRCHESEKIEESDFTHWAYWKGPGDRK